MSVVLSAHNLRFGKVVHYASVGRVHLSNAVGEFIHPCWRSEMLQRNSDVSPFVRGVPVIFAHVYVAVVGITTQFYAKIVLFVRIF